MADAEVSPSGLKPVAQAARPKSANSLSPAAGTGPTGYQILAINDLGMHCGDLDTRVASILPPFNVLHTQVVARAGTESWGRPRRAWSTRPPPTQATHPEVTDGPGDRHPARPNSGARVQDQLLGHAYQAYDPFYPAGILSTPTAHAGTVHRMDPTWACRCPTSSKLDLGRRTGGRSAFDAEQATDRGPARHARRRQPVLWQRRPTSRSTRRPSRSSRTSRFGYTAET